MQSVHMGFTQPITQPGQKQWTFTFTTLVQLILPDSQSSFCLINAGTQVTWSSAVPQHLIDFLPYVLAPSQHVYQVSSVYWDI